MSLANIDYPAMKFLMDIAHWIALVALAIWGYLRTKDKDNAEAVKAVAKELAQFIKASTEANHEQNTRLTVLEQAVEHLPTEQDMAHLSNDVATVKAQMNGMASLLSRIEHQTNLIHDHLLNGKTR